MSAVAVEVVGRNSPCPCGSGAKAKRCHPARVGERPQTAAQARMAGWLARVTGELAGMTGYVPPPDGEDGWSRENFRETGCPYRCTGGADAEAPACLGGCAAGCGV